MKKKDKIEKVTGFNTWVRVSDPHAVARTAEIGEYLSEMNRTINELVDEVNKLIEQHSDV